MQRIAAVETTISDFANTPFSWGDADCMTFICAYLTAAGCHPDDIRHGHWKSERAALRGVRQLGHDSLASLLDAYFERIPRIRARDGDLALVKTADDWGGAAGLVAAHRVHAMGRDGLQRLPLQDVQIVWRPQCQK